MSSASRSASEKHRQQRERHRGDTRHLGQAGRNVYDNGTPTATQYGGQSKGRKLGIRRLLSRLITTHKTLSNSQDNPVSYSQHRTPNGGGGRDGVGSGPQTWSPTPTTSSSQHGVQTRVATQVNRNKLGRLDEALRSNPVLVDPGSTKGHETRQHHAMPTTSRPAEGPQRPVFRLEVTPPSESRADSEVSRDAQRPTRQSHGFPTSQLTPPRSDGNWYRLVYRHEKVNEALLRENQRLEREKNELISERQRLKQEMAKLAAEKEDMRQRFNHSWRTLYPVLMEIRALEIEMGGSHRVRDESASPGQRLRDMVVAVEASHTRQLQALWRKHEQTVAELESELERVNRILRYHIVAESRHGVGASPRGREDGRVWTRYPVRV